MHTPTVPQNRISRIRLDLLPPTTPIVEPLHVFFCKVETIPPGPSSVGHLGKVGVEELVVEFEGAFEDGQAAVFRTVR